MRSLHRPWQRLVVHIVGGWSVVLGVMLTCAHAETLATPRSRMVAPEERLTLVVEGACTEPAVVSVSGATPHGLVDVLAAEHEGTSLVPVGSCAGLTTDLRVPKLVLILATDSDGNASALLDVELGECGTRLQALDGDRCELSALASIHRLKTDFKMKLLAPGGVVEDRFGAAVAAQGETAIVGALADDSAGLGSGAAWIFERVRRVWTPTVELVAPGPDLEGYELLGSSVALDRDTAVAGAPGEFSPLDKPGSAWVFERHAGGPGGWGAVAQLHPSDHSDAGQFGAAVGVAADWVAVGATGGFAEDAPGSVYLYARDEGGPGAWGEVVKLQPPDSRENDGFGAALDIQDGRLVVGAFGDDDLGNNSGSAYIYDQEALSGAWLLTAKVTASDGSSRDRFGAAVAVDGDTIAIGAPEANPGPNVSGAVYLFQHGGDGGGWSEIARLVPSDANRSMAFGDSLDLEGSVLVVGEPNDGSGSAYLFGHAGDRWLQSARISEPLVGNYGIAVAIDGESLLVGSSEDSEQGDEAGAVFVHNWSRPNGATD